MLVGFVLHEGLWRSIDPYILPLKTPFLGEGHCRPSFIFWVQLGFQMSHPGGHVGQGCGPPFLLSDGVYDLVFVLGFLAMCHKGLQMDHLVALLPRVGGPLHL